MQKLILIITLLLLLSGCQKQSNIINHSSASPLAAINIFIPKLKSAEAKPGLANFMLQMLPAGSIQHSKSELAKRLETLGGSIDLKIYNDYAVLSGVVLAENAEDYLGCLKEILTTPAFQGAEIEKTRADLIQALEQEQENPVIQAIRANREWNFNGTIYAYPAIGTTTSLRQIQRADLVNSHTFLLKQKPLIVLTGQWPNSQIVQQFAGNFGQETISSNATYQIPTGQKTINKNFITNILLINFSAPKIEPKTYAEQELLASYFGDGLSSPLFKLTREKMAIAYSSGAFYEGYRQAGLFVVYVQTSLEDIATLHKKVLEIFTIPSNNELAKIKNYYITNYYRNNQGILAKGNEIGRNTTLGLGSNYDLAQAIEKVSFAKSKVPAQLNTLFLH